MKKKSWKILIIDDDPGILKVTSLALEDAGYEVITAADGYAGVDLFEEALPDIVITDIRMPGLDGMEVLRRIKELDPLAEVIVITAFSEMDLAIKALQLDASDFITKPVNQEALMVALKRAKERYSARRDIQDYTAIIEERWMRTAEELAKTFRFQKMLIESSIDGIVAGDREGKVIIFNKSMEEMLCFAWEEVMGRMRLEDFFAPGEYEKFQRTLASEVFGGKDRLQLYETFLAAKNGTKIPCQLLASVLFENGEEVGLVIFFRDMRTIRKMTQEFADQARMLHQDKMISLGRLAASVVHEINNPLAGILNYARLMMKMLNRGSLTPESTSKFESYLSLMESELSRCSKIVSNLLSFSRKSKLEFSELNLGELLSRCITLSHHKLTLQNIQIQERISPDIPKVIGDFNQLQQCIINLIFNAIDAMPNGGVIGIETSFNSRRELVEIKVSDTGCGIAKADLQYIFDPFFTTKTEGKGLGLGLSTVYGIIDRHKGTITAESEPGHGTVFTIKLPVNPKGGEGDKPQAG